jgi:hypothetical protein
MHGAVTTKTGSRREGVGRPRLTDVTLVAATSVALQATVQALQASMREAEFGQVLLLSDEPPRDAGSQIVWKRIERLGSSSDYSRFMLRELADHISTSHALCVQWDGFVLHGRAWDSAFLDYDYIGAPWPQFGDDHNVGNGGFSLRSRRLLETCKRLPWPVKEPEDVVISRLERARLEMEGMRFAPESVARRFSYERMRTTGSEFGFHGAFNLVRYLSSREALELFGGLEPEMLARSECFELFRWAAVRGRLRLAKTLFARLMRTPQPSCPMVQTDS